jgi:hypothetical protein
MALQGIYSIWSYEVKNLKEEEEETNEDTGQFHSLIMRSQLAVE